MNAKLSTVWKILTSGPAVAALAVVLVMAGECRSFRGKAKEDARPQIAPPTKTEARSEVVTLPCEEIQVIEPSKRDRERLAETYKRPDLKPTDSGVRGIGQLPESGATVPETRIIGERELPELPNGGTALVTLEPGGRVEVTVKPEPERVFDLRATWELGAMAGKGFNGETRGRAWGAVEAVRFGRLHLRAEAGADVRAGVTDGYGMVGVVWRSR